MLEFLKKWWWPAFVFLYPLVFYPDWTQNVTLTKGIEVHNSLLYIFLVGGIALELLLHPEIKFSDLKSLPKWIFNNKIILFLVLYAISISISASISTRPESSWIGFLSGYIGSAAITIGFIMSSILIYLRRTEDSTTDHRIFHSIISSGFVVSIIAILEVILQHGLLKKTYRLADIPAAAFGSTGYLAGFCAVVATLSAHQYNSSKKPIYLISFIFNIIALGLTGNRAGLLGLAMCLIVLFFANNTKRQTVILALSGAFIVLGVWFGISKTQIGAQDPTRLQTLSTRAIYVKMGLAGWKDRPVFGWGTNQFPWWGYTDPKSLEEMIKAEGLSQYGDVEKLKLISIPSIKDSPETTEFIFKVNDGSRFGILPFRFTTWNSHNFYVDLLYNSGILGFIFFVICLVISTQNIKKSPFSLAIICFIIYLYFWYLGYELNSTLWILLVLGSKIKERSSNNTSNLKSTYDLV
jgi:hypothetical protein